MKRIALIKKNRVNFDQIEEYASPLLYKKLNKDTILFLKKSLNDYIWSVVSPFITFIDVDSSEDLDLDLMTVICTNLTNEFDDKSPDDFFYRTEGSYSSPKRFIELVHCQPTWSSYEPSTEDNLSPMNNIGCLFSLEHNVIENSCVLIVNSYDLNLDRFISLDSITKEDICRVVRRRYFYTGVLVDPTESFPLIKYYYQDPAYLISSIYSKNSIQHLSFTHLKYNLVMHFENNDNDQPTNEICSRINSTHRIKGKCLILHEMDENVFCNLSIHEVKRLNVLSYGTIQNRQLLPTEMHSFQIQMIDEHSPEKKICPLWSRYIVLNSRMLKWKETKNKCFNCGNNMLIPIVCNGCYRIKYCSSSCQKEFRHLHQSECELK